MARADADETTEVGASARDLQIPDDRSTGLRRHIGRTGLLFAGRAIKMIMTPPTAQWPFLTNSPRS